MKKIHIEKQVNVITGIFFSLRLKYRRRCRQRDGFSEKREPKPLSPSLLSPFEYIALIARNDFALLLFVVLSILK